MANLPRPDVIEQSIALNGFTDDGDRSGHIDLDDLLAAGSLFLFWKLSVTTRFTGGVGAGAELIIGTPSNADAFSLAGWRRLQNGASNDHADVPRPELAVDGAGLVRTVRVTIRDTADFGNISGGAFDLSVYSLRTEV